MHSQSQWPRSSAALGQLCSGAKLPCGWPGWPGWPQGGLLAAPRRSRQPACTPSALGGIFGSLAPCPADSCWWLLQVLVQGKAPNCKAEKVTRSKLSAPQHLQLVNSIWWIPVGLGFCLVLVFFSFSCNSLQMLKGGYLQHMVGLLLPCMSLAW